MRLSYSKVSVLLTAIAACKSPNVGSTKGRGVEPENTTIPGSRNTFWLTAPEPFASNVSTTQTIVFEAEIDEKVSHRDVESSVTVSPRGSNITLPGTFSWTERKDAYGSVWNVVFTPVAPLTEGQDYLISIRPYGSFAPSPALFVDAKPTLLAYRAPFTTGSHPRVSSVKIISKDAATVAYVQIRFSEPVGAKALQDAFALKLDGKQLAGSFEFLGGAPAQEFNFFLDPPRPSLSQVVTLHIGVVATPRGTVLDPTSFDSQTNVDGQFSLVLQNKQLLPCAVDNNCWLWMPVLK